MNRVYTLLQGLAVMALSSSVAFASEGGAPLDPAVGWDHLWYELMIDIGVIGVIFWTATFYMALKYRTDSIDKVGSAPRLSTAQAVGWAIIPMFVFLADDFYLAAKGWDLWLDYRTVPSDSFEVKVTGSQWNWEYDYGDGVTSDVLRVPAGKPVVLRMTSEDVIHSFFLPQHRVKEDMMPGRITYIWFRARPGTTLVTCTEYCGTGHSDMYGDVVGMPEAEFYSWLKGEQGGSSAMADPADVEPAEETAEAVSASGDV